MEITTLCHLQTFFLIIYKSFGMKINVAKVKILALASLGKALELFDIKIHGQLVEHGASLPCLGNILK